MELVPTSSIDNKKILCKIKTNYYIATCKPYNITIKWQNGSDSYDEPNIDTIIKRIYKYSEQELLFYYEKNIYYTNKKGVYKEIIKNVDIGGWQITYYERHKKLGILSDIDPPDVFYLFPINKIIENCVDMNDDKNNKEYEVATFNDWNTTCTSDENYLYAFDENGLDTINIKTHEYINHPVKFDFQKTKKDNSEENKGTAKNSEKTSEKNPESDEDDEDDSNDDDECYCYSLKINNNTLTIKMTNNDDKVLHTMKAKWNKEHTQMKKI